MSKEVQFTEEDVEGWCEENGDENPIHIDPEEASDSVFGERVIPGMMLLDKISGMLVDVGEEDEDVILYGITAARFRDPVLIGDEVTFTITDITKHKNYTAVDLEAHVESRSSLVLSACVSVVVD